MNARCLMLLSLLVGGCSVTINAPNATVTATKQATGVSGATGVPSVPFTPSPSRIPSSTSPTPTEAPTIKPTPVATQSPAPTPVPSASATASPKVSPTPIPQESVLLSDSLRTPSNLSWVAYYFDYDNDRITFKSNWEDVVDAKGYEAVISLGTDAPDWSSPLVVKGDDHGDGIELSQGNVPTPRNDGEGRLYVRAWKLNASGAREYSHVASVLVKWVREV